MYRKTRRFVLLILSLACFVATFEANAQTAANGPYYATPSWDQKLQCDTKATCPRFIVLSNWNSDAVLDRETGLVWEKAPSTFALNWFGALNHCEGLNLGGRMGWRLPVRTELMSLVDQSQSNPALPAGQPFTLPAPSPSYWTATTLSGSPGQARIVLLSIGAFGTSGKNLVGVNGVWCVRGGAGLDPQ